MLEYLLKHSNRAVNKFQGYAYSIVYINKRRSIVFAVNL